MTYGDWQENLVAPSTPVLDVMALIESRDAKIALVVDEARQLLGTVTDGDIRRGILRGVPVTGPVEQLMFREPTTAPADATPDAILGLMRQKQLLHIPLLDAAGRLTSLETLDELEAGNLRDNCVVLMAGGLGTRLRPLTEDIPKPLLKVGDKPILETILADFAAHGFHKFYLSVNYKAEMLIDHFGDGSRWGVDIHYLHETDRLGTAGALSLLPERPDKPFFVMNGDLLTKVNFGHLLDFHARQSASATMCVREYDFQVPYGVIKLDGQRIAAIEEKPVHRFFVNAGIYVLEPSCLDLIPHRRYFDMPSLFDQLVVGEQNTAAFPIHEYWLDIGRMEDFERANQEYGERW